jgi:hypothetical protein
MTAANTSPILHTTIKRSLSNIWKEKGGKGGPVIVAVFFMLFRGLHALADIYPYIFRCFGFKPFHYHPQRRLICLLFFYFSFGALESNVNIDWPHTLPIHCLFSTALRSLLHAYHSLLVWPLYQREHLLCRAPHGK